MNKSVAVVGAGISGLVLAYRLKKKGFEVTVFESSTEVGGKIKTIHRDGFELDLGPVSCAETESLKALITELKLQNEVLPAQGAVSKRYIYSKGKIHGIQPSPLKLLTHPILSLKGKLSLLKDVFIKPASEQIEDESVADFVRRHFGEEAHEKLFNPVLHGIYAGDSNKLSITSTLKMVKNMAKKYGSVIKGLKTEKDQFKNSRKIISMRGGFGKLMEAMQSDLEKQIHFSAEVKKLRIDNDQPILTVSEGGNEKEYSFSKIYFALPAFAAAKTLTVFHSEISEQLGKIKYNKVWQIYVETDLNENQFDGFGFLIPAEEKLSLLGAICISNIFPDKAPANKKLFALFCGGDRPYAFNADVNQSIEEFKSILKPSSIKTLHVQEWNNAIPQFHVGHQAILNQLKSFEEKNPSIAFAGNYVSGVSLGDCVEYGKIAAIQFS